MCDRCSRRVGRCVRGVREVCERCVRVCGRCVRGLREVCERCEWRVRGVGEVGERRRRAVGVRFGEPLAVCKRAAGGLWASCVIVFVCGEKVKKPAG